MSGPKGFNGLYVNIGLLRDHIADVTDQKNLVQQILDKIVLLQRMDVEGPQDQYHLLQQRISNLVRYYRQLGITLDEIEEKAVLLSHDIRDAIWSDTEETIDTVNHFFL